MARTVLVADDSPTVQKKASGILTGEGLEVVTVSNGVTAIKKLPTVKPLVVLADVAMPGKDGYEVCEFVKNSPELRHVPVLLVFSADDVYDEAKGTRCRADGRIKKPFDPAELISTVTKFISQAEAAAPQAQAAPPAPKAPAPEFAMVTEPVDEEPVVPTRKGVDMAGLSQEIAFAEPALEEAPAPAAEPAAASPEPIMEAEVHAEPEAAAATYAETPISAEPLLTEEPAVAPETPPAPASERTMMFRVPSEIAEPVLSDEAVPAPPSPSDEAEAEGAPIAATTLESYSLTDAAAGQVRFAPPGGEIAAEPDAAVAPEPAPAPAAFDRNLIYTIVYKAVVKMSPPALSAQTIDEMAMRLAEEIAAELSSESTSPQ